MYDCLHHLFHLSKQCLLLLQHGLVSVAGTLELIDGGVEGGVGSSCPLQTLRDTELLAVNLLNAIANGGG